MIKLTENEIRQLPDEDVGQLLGEELFGWSFFKTGDGNLPEPSQALVDALEGRSGPIFWHCFNPKGSFFQVAKPNTEKAIPWNPFQSEEDRVEVLAAVASRGGTVSIQGGSISVRRADRGSAVISGDSPRLICEAALRALSTAPVSDD